MSFRTSFKEIRQFFCESKNGSIIIRDSIFLHKSSPLIIWELRQSFSYLIYPFFFQYYRNQIGLRKIPVVMSLLFGPHGYGDAFGFIPASGFLNYGTTFRENLLMPFLFIFQCFLQCFHRVHIFDFRFYPELFLSCGPYGNIGITSEGAFLHLAVGDIEINQHFLSRNRLARPLRGKMFLQKARRHGSDSFPEIYHPVIFFPLLKQKHPTILP
ncbi:hypothetical protein SDC9_75260 [bioreactor metagenome]|uniref:Uncharacterized protein n=1 Tax=bioreactor metagenome TaxID=1076179 RepID=A0A644YJC9_9ZZZZ